MEERDCGEGVTDFEQDEHKITVRMMTVRGEGGIEWRRRGGRERETEGGAVGEGEVRGDKEERSLCGDAKDGPHVNLNPCRERQEGRTRLEWRRGWG